MVSIVRSFILLYSQEGAHHLKNNSFSIKDTWTGWKSNKNKGNFGLVTFDAFISNYLESVFFASKRRYLTSLEPVILFSHQNSYVGRYWWKFLEMPSNSIAQTLCVCMCVCVYVWVCYTSFIIFLLRGLYVGFKLSM